MMSEPVPPAAMTPQIRDDLETFVAHVKHLRSSKFGRNVLAQDAVTLRTRGAFEDVEFVGLDDDELRSFLLGCRMLIQNNDRISVSNVWSACKELIRPPEAFAPINAQRWMLNDFLDQPASFADHTRKSLTHAEILKTFLYGNYAHVERAHAARLRQWQTSPSTYAALKLTFILVLKALLQTAGAMADGIETWLTNDRSVTKVAHP
jgi:hypothetical protein